MGVQYKLSVKNIQTIIEGVAKVVAENAPTIFLQPTPHPAAWFDTGSRVRAFIPQLTILSTSCPFESMMLTATGTPPSRRWVAQDIQGS